MSIAIYTYRNPYLLEQESFWNEIKSCPYFCASQTLVNGLKSLYPDDFRQGKVTTVQNLTESAYEYWLSTPCAVRQYAELDNIISELLSALDGGAERENALRALQFNRGEVFKSIRALFELDTDPEALRPEGLTPEQSLVVEIYRRILRTDSRRFFALPEELDEAQIEKALVDAMLQGRAGDDYAQVQKSRIVIHGVHQFTPLMLRLIEQIAKYKKVILLFNYQSQYRNVYQTWIDIYSAFECPIFISKGAEFRPDSKLTASYACNLLADDLGKMIEGRMADVHGEAPCTILEFDNITEFANYAADLFEEAVRRSPKSPMAAMREQIYSADASVNNILKIYFPEQFGERQFLNYPLGRFFVSIANMWDVEARQLAVSDLKDVQECLSADIIQEERKGLLSTLFRRVETLVEGCGTLREMAARLKRVKENRSAASEETRARMARLSYYALTDAELDALIGALRELDRLAKYFYDDFEDQPHNFQRFYRRLQDYLQDEVLEQDALDQEFADIVKRVLARLDEVADTDASASFDCLRATMNVYLQQQRKAHTSANWIIRPFEQLDGDILRSQGEAQRERVIYHFACLSDEDLLCSSIPPFPWPLSEGFFESAREQADWKGRVYVRARMEYKNFKRYALLYAMEFNRAGFKLSYVRRKDEVERDFYYLLKLYGAKVEYYRKGDVARPLSRSAATSFPSAGGAPYAEADLCRFRLCRYRFLTETLAEGATVYKDRFLQVKYLEIWLENRIREEMQGLPNSEIGLNDQLERRYDEVRRYFPQLSSVDRTDVINNVRRQLSGLKFFPRINGDALCTSALRESFLRTRSPGKYAGQQDPLREVFAFADAETIRSELSDERLSRERWRTWVRRLCLYCPNKDLCSVYYSIDRRK